MNGGFAGYTIVDFNGACPSDISVYNVSKNPNRSSTSIKNICNVNRSILQILQIYLLIVAFV